MKFRQRSGWWLWGFSFLCLPFGCAKSPPPKTLGELYEEERGLPAVFLLAGTNEKIVAPGNQGVFVQDGTLCWPALTCHNPDCPAQSTPEAPFLFSAPDKAVIVNADGTIGYDRSRLDTENYFGNCPECLKIRKLAAESDEDRQRYSNWVQPYVLPETARRREELAAARQQREADLRERMQHSGK